jgi:hypothetical protein
MLTKQELRHLKEVRIATKKAFVRLNKVHNNQRTQNEALEPCYWCKGIAIKLGIPVMPITRPYGYRAWNTFTIDSERVKAKMKPIVHIKNRYVRRAMLCIAFVPAMAVAVIHNEIAKIPAGLRDAGGIFIAAWKEDVK